MNLNPKVSYVLPAYNGERFIAESITSVLNQTYQNLELIVVIDGPDDSTPQIVESFHDPRMKVISQPNLGMSFARNRGIAVASGDIIGSISHDDVFLPEKTEVQLREMAEKGLDFCFTWAEIIDDQGNPLEHRTEKVFNQSTGSSVALREKLKKGNFLLAPSFLCRRECYHHFAWNVVLFGFQDYALWLKMCRRFEGAVLEFPLVKYRVHDENVSLSERFTPEYRWFEDRASRALATFEEIPETAVVGVDSLPRTTELLKRAEELFPETDPQLTFLAYLFVNRAVNTTPTYQPAYEILSTLLLSMGFEYPALLVKEIGANVVPQHFYPSPLVSKEITRTGGVIEKVLGLLLPQKRW